MLRLSLIFFCLSNLLISCVEKSRNSSNSIAPVAIPQESFVSDYFMKMPPLALSHAMYNTFENENCIFYGLVHKQNKKQGYWKIFHKQDSLLFQGYFVDDIKKGWWWVLHNKTLLCAGNFEQDMKQGYWQYFEQGENKTTKYVNYLDDKLHGLAREFTADSVLIADGDFMFGLKSGYWKFYYNNAVLKENGNFSKNAKSGWWQCFDILGRISVEANYMNNIISGYVKKYKNGIIFQEGIQINDRHYGTWKYYDNKGNPLKIVEFDAY